MYFVGKQVELETITLNKKKAKKGEYLFFLFEESRLENKYVFIYTHIYVAYTYESRNKIIKREKEV